MDERSNMDTESHIDRSMYFDLCKCLQVFADHFIYWKPSVLARSLAFMDSPLGTCWMDAFLS